jgi:hypothetical protein
VSSASAKPITPISVASVRDRGGEAHREPGRHADHRQRAGVAQRCRAVRLARRRLQDGLQREERRRDERRGERLAPRHAPQHCDGDARGDDRDGERHQRGGRGHHPLLENRGQL